MRPKKCVYVLLIADWQISLGRLTLPLIEAYAKKIGADLVTITERKFPDWPVVYEKHQIFELGKKYDWNIAIDVDVLVHPDTEDFTAWHPSSHVGNWWFKDIRNVFDPTRDPEFAQDSRYYGIIDCLVVTSPFTHDLWRPLPGKFEQYQDLFRNPDHWTTVIYSLSKNLARNRYPISGVLRSNTHVVLLEHRDEGIGSRENEAAMRLKEWGVIVSDTSSTPRFGQALSSFAFMNVPYGAALAEKLRKDFGLDITVSEGSLEDMSRQFASLDPQRMPIMGIPRDTACDDNNQKVVTSLLEGTRSSRRGVSLITSFRHDSRDSFSAVTSRWNISLMELASQYRTAFIDLDVFMGMRGSDYLLSSERALTEEGLNLMADYFVKTVQHKAFAPPLAQ